jgi:hypothetical protein
MPGFSLPSQVVLDVHLEVAFQFGIEFSGALSPIEQSHKA